MPSHLGRPTDADFDISPKKIRTIDNEARISALHVYSEGIAQIGEVHARSWIVF
jgi:hypothetical protein